jgi:hypothetical protein
MSTSCELYELWKMTKSRCFCMSCTRFLIYGNVTDSIVIITTVCRTWGRCLVWAVDNNNGICSIWRWRRQFEKQKRNLTAHERECKRRKVWLRNHPSKMLSAGDSLPCKIFAASVIKVSIAEGPHPLRHRMRGLSHSGWGPLYFW